jgi:hypothetical protein
MHLGRKRTVSFCDEINVKSMIPENPFMLKERKLRAIKVVYN